MPTNQTKTPEDLRPYVITHAVLIINLAAVTLFVVFGWLGWSHAYNNPHRVFQGMLRNNLSTPSITRTTTSAGSSSMTKVEQVSFVPTMASRAVVTIEEKGQTAQSRVQSETIGTLTDDFSRYLSISTSQKNTAGKPLDYSSVENVWGKSSLQTGPRQYFSQAVLGLVPFANLSSTTRGKILQQLESKNAYTVDYKNVKPKKLDGKSALVFPVKINLSAYVGVLQTLVKDLGVSNIGDLNPENYTAQPPIEATMTIDKLSRQILQVSYSGQNEYYSSYGLTTPIELPTKTIPVTDLQQKVQEVR